MCKLDSEAFQYLKMITKSILPLDRHEPYQEIWHDVLRGYFISTYVANLYDVMCNMK